MYIEDKIKDYLEKLPNFQGDSKFIASSQEHEKEAIKNSPIILRFLKECNREFLDFDISYQEVGNELGRMKSRKDFYSLLLSKSLNKKDLEINFS